jgi:hypothetical protein
MSTGVLRDGGILLHIGPHKTGTTAIQAALAAARPQLRAAGIIYPGHRLAHNRPAVAALRRTLGWDHAPVDQSHWRQLIERTRSYDGRVVLSSEVFCEGSAEDAARIVDELGRGQVQVALTLRPLETLLPSNWQQYVKNGYQNRYFDWLELVLASPDKQPDATSFWVRHDHPALLRRWCEATGGPENVVVVIADAARPRNLFDAFEDLLLLPRGTLESGAGPSNRSLSLPEVELLRQLNVLARPTLRQRDHHRFVKHGAVLKLVEGRRPAPDEPRLTTPRWAVARARELSRSDVKDIAAMGVTVLGDLNALAPETALAATESDAESDAGLEAIPIDVAADFLFSLLSSGVEVHAAAAQAAAAARAEAAR